jgi:hypothetical protein
MKRFKLNEMILSKSLLVSFQCNALKSANNYSVDSVIKQWECLIL